MTGPLSDVSPWQGGLNAPLVATPEAQALSLAAAVFAADAEVAIEIVRIMREDYGEFTCSL